jgi:hypothetical protein
LCVEVELLERFVRRQLAEPHPAIESALLARGDFDLEQVVLCLCRAAGRSPSNRVNLGALMVASRRAIAPAPVVAGMSDRRVRGRRAAYVGARSGPGCWRREIG